MEWGQVYTPRPRRHAFARVNKDGILKLFRSLRIDTKESITPAHVAWRAGTTTPIPNRFLAPKIVQ